ncbi:MAG: CehA/McbA family metallohydrolase [Myxococcota bacterium]
MSRTRTWAWVMAATLAIASCDEDGATSNPSDAGPDVVADTATPDAGPDATVDADAIPTCPPAAPATGEVRARTLGCPEDLTEGLLAAARPGDVVLENAVSRFVIRTAAEGHALMGLTGGNVVDAVRMEDGAQVGGDGLREYVMTADFHLLAPDGVAVVDDGSAGVARVRVTGTLEPFVTVMEAFPVTLDPETVIMEAEYVLRPDEPVLELRSRFLATAEDRPVTVTAWDLAFWGGELRQFLPGHPDPELPSAGFAPLLGATPVSPDVDLPSYASAADLSRQVLNLGPVKGFNFDPVDADADGGEVVRWLAVGGRDGDDLAGALAAVAERSGAPLKRASGTVQGDAWPGVVVEARDDDGAPVARCRPDPEGTFDCRVPAEATRLVAVWLGESAGDPGGTRIEGADAAVGEGVTVPAPEPATLTLRVTDGEAAPVPFRLTAQRDGPDGVEEHRVVDADGEASVRLPTGEWEIWVTHGPRHAWHHEAMSLAPGDLAERDVALPQVVDTPGWVAADLHVHTEQSPDSDVPTARRLVGALAEGLDYMVASEHDFVADHGPWHARAGVGGRLVVRSGVEASTMRLGHFNVWPLTVDPSLSGQGAPGWHGIEMDGLWDLLGVGDGRIVQCNHPRFGSGYEAFFDALGLDEATPDDLLACDTMELVNGGRPHEDTPQVLADWSGLLDRGIRVTATGTSDTHRTDEPVGVARTWVRVGDLADDFHGAAPGDAATAVEDALRAGRAVASVGPFATVTLVTDDDREAAIGDTLEDPGAAVTARVEVQSPAWMPLGTLEVLVDGEVVREEDLSATEPSDGRHHAVIEVPVTVDGSDRWVAAWHRDAPAPNPGAHRPPWVVTNPVFVDGDGDGAWTGRADAAR